MARRPAPDVPFRPTGVPRHGAQGWSDPITMNAPNIPGINGVSQESSASGNKYYVGDSGSDSNSGDTKDSSFATFAPLSDAGTSGYVPTPANNWHNVSASVNWQGNNPDLGAYESQ